MYVQLVLLGFPNVVIEAKASGLPVLSPVAMEVPNLSIFQFGGVLVDDPDPMAWAEAITPQAIRNWF
jgi:glycosyltransferase involved in cell wall biosynthesis